MIGFERAGLLFYPTERLTFHHHDQLCGSERDDRAWTYKNVSAHVANHLVMILENNMLEFEDGTPLTEDEALDVLTELCRRYCRDNDLKRPPGKFTRRKLGRIYRTDQPQLSSRYKACHVKVLIMFITTSLNHILLIQLHKRNHPRFLSAFMEH